MNSFVQNVNTLANKLEIVESANSIFDEGVIPILEEIALLDLDKAVADLKKGNYLGNRKIDINLALNMQGITEELLETNSTAAAAIWTDAGKTVSYDRATITFTDGTVIQLPFKVDNNPISISTHGDLVSQFNRLDITEGVGQTDTVGSITLESLTVYRITIEELHRSNGPIVFEYTSDDTAIVSEIINYFVTEINNSAALDVVATAYTNTFTIEPNNVANNITTTTSTNMEVISTSGSTETQFLAKLDGTTIRSFAFPVVGEIVRFYDIIGDSSNIENIQLHAVSGNYIEANPIYYWAKTTSAFQTLAMRAGDIIKLGNELDNIILLASSINQILEIQDRIPELVDTYIDGVAQGDLTIYNKLAELDAIYQELVRLIAIYDDIKVGGTNYINTSGADLQDPNSDIIAVSTDLQDLNSKVIEVADNLQGTNTVETVGLELQDPNDKITEVGTDLQGSNYITTVGTDLQLGVASTIKITADNIDEVGVVAADLDLGAASTMRIVGTDLLGADTVGTVAGSIANVNLTGASIVDVNTVATDLDLGVDSAVKIVAADLAGVDSIGTVAANIAEVLQADTNAQTATTQAGIATAQAVIATTQAGIATAKADEIKGITVASTVTGAAGTSAAVTYNSTSGQFTFVVPQGVKGDKGDSFEVNAVGLLTSRSLYDGQPVGFSFLAVDTAEIYFKLSGTSGDWSVAAPFGKGETGDTGATGNGILDIVNTNTTGLVDTYTITYTDATTDTFTVTNAKSISDVSFTSTTDPGGLAGVAGADDTYTITFNDATTTIFVIHNGSDTVVSSVAGRIGDVVLKEADITDLDKYTQSQVNTALSGKADTSHTHVEADITDLDKYTQAEVDSALANKQDAGINPVVASIIFGG